VIAVSTIDEFVYLLDEAFAGRGIEETGESQSLMSNLRSVSEDAWRGPLTGAGRTIESIALHVGGCKVMYDDHAFGPGLLGWDDSEVEPWSVGAAPMSAVLAWLEGAHRRFVGHVRSLNEDELSVPRLTNWGERRETRWLIATILQHDTYHAGEINHLRALIVGDDTWRWGAG
jgi:hypothetical protein